MSNIKLSTRLLKVAEFVRNDSIMADIGTDHGLLVCHLVTQGIVYHGYACDINPLPLKRARQTILENGLEKMVDVILTDGLLGLDQFGISDVVIAGMGGELIGEIISKAGWIKSPQINLILQPMSRDHKLRQRLYELGFQIIREKAVKSGKHFYTIIQAKYTDTSEKVSDDFAWGGLLWGSLGGETVGYLRNRLNKLKDMRPAFTKGDGYEEMIRDWEEKLNDVQSKRLL